MLASCLTAPLRLSFFALVLLAAPLVAWGQDEYEIGPVPQWVTPFSVDFDAAPPADQASGGVYYLLLDDQVRVADGGPDVYSRYVLKVLDDEGIQQAAQFAVDFDPSYQRLTLHEVRVRRGGAYHDRLRPENVSVLRRETDLEQQIYDGRKTANVILDEVRVGDVVEYSYTVSGANPIFDGRYAHGFYTEYPVPVHHFRHRLLWPAGRTLHTKAHGAAPEPTRSRQGGFIEYRWEQNEVAARISDGDTPAWYEPYAWVQVSEWGAWGDVVRWAEPMYAPRPQAVRAQAAEIARHDSSAEGQLLAALRFAQEEIRYLGFEMGRGSHEPRPPDVVLEQRFGDCKDKSRLLISLLQALGIEAYPAFVHTRWYDALAEWLPTPFAFNHVIVVAHLDGERYWLDPTQRHQRGLLPYLSQPDYGQALVVRPGTTGLVAVDPPRREGPDKEVRETFHLAERDGEPTTYSVRTVFYGASADAMRGTPRPAEPAGARQGLPELLRLGLSGHRGHRPHQHPRRRGAEPDLRERALHDPGFLGRCGGRGPDARRVLRQRDEQPLLPAQHAHPDDAARPRAPLPPGPHDRGAPPRALAYRERGRPRGGRGAGVQRGGGLRPRSPHPHLHLPHEGRPRRPRTGGGIPEEHRHDRRQPRLPDLPIRRRQRGGSRPELAAATARPLHPRHLGSLCSQGVPPRALRRATRPRRARPALPGPRRLAHPRRHRCRRATFRDPRHGRAGAPRGRPRKLERPNESGLCGVPPVVGTYAPLRDRRQQRLGRLRRPYGRALLPTPLLLPSRLLHLPRRERRPRRPRHRPVRVDPRGGGGADAPRLRGHRPRGRRQPDLDRLPPHVEAGGVDVRAATGRRRGRRPRRRPSRRRQTSTPSRSAAARAYPNKKRRADACRPARRFSLQKPSTLKTAPRPTSA